MAKQTSKDQLPLDLEASVNKEDSSQERRVNKKNVVPFIDASTRAIREEARKRVDASGVFANPSPGRVKN